MRPQSIFNLAQLSIKTPMLVKLSLMLLLSALPHLNMITDLALSMIFPALMGSISACYSSSFFSPNCNNNDVELNAEMNNLYKIAPFLLN